MAAIRCFVALDLTSAVVRVLGSVSKKLSTELGSVRWVKSGNHHLTLQFLGDVDVGRLDDISVSIDRIAVCHSPIQVGLDALGAFPHPARANVIWVGIAGDLRGLNILQKDLSTELQSVGFEPDSRPFRPHLTMGRSRQPIILPEREAVPSMDFDLATVSLVKSDLGKVGPQYTNLHTAYLGKCQKSSVGS
jgi:2'-5' RNA ligase